MSGTGKSSALELLNMSGFETVDTDTDEWSRWETQPDGTLDWIWKEDAMTSLLLEPREIPLFVAGCKSNQGSFYPLFDHIVLLSAPVDVILERVTSRTNNPYGKDPEERQLIMAYVETIEPRLRSSATLEIDTSVPLLDVVRQLALLAIGE
jgi:dephospho-CoA kinase